MKTQIKNNLKKKLAVLRARRGFSLVELLVVIAVIGVIAAIAIPNIAGITGAAGGAKNLRNAQTVCSVFSSAVASGWDPSTATPTAVSDVPTAIDAMVTGCSTGSGATLATFQVPMSAGEVSALKADTSAMSKLTYNTTAKTLSYTN